MAKSFFQVNNIPGEYGVSDLRTFFSNAVEANLFECFHFLKRPTKTSCKVSNSQEQSNALISDTTYCCVIRVSEASVPRLMRDYNGAFWTCPATSGLLDPPRQCVIAAFTGNKGVETTMYEDYKTRKELLSVRSPGTIPTFLSNQDDTDDKAVNRRISQQAMALQEMNPPPILSRGNVGTPTAELRRLIAQCKLPTSVLRTLKPQFNHRRNTQRAYGEVPFDYTGLKDPAEERSCTEQIREQRLSGTSRGKKRRRTVSRPTSPSERRPWVEPVDLKKNFLQKRVVPGDDDGAEIWDMPPEFEVPTRNQTHTENRLDYCFEEPRSVANPWDKGDASGLVFYTDALHWERQRGSVEEQLTDGWGVSHHHATKDHDSETVAEESDRERASCCTTPEHICSGSSSDEKAGESLNWTKDKSFLSIKSGRGQHKTKTRRKGKEEHSGNSMPLAHQLLVKMGWCPGKGMGKLEQGIKQPLEVDGSTSLAGLGYTGHVKKRPQKKRMQHIIGSIFDSPPQSPGVQSQPPCNKISEGVFRLLTQEERTSTIDFVKGQKN